MSTAWYYADAGGRQVGPISADELRAAIRRGSASASTLAWREGLAEWTPISKLAEELQLELGAVPPAPPAPPPLAGAATANPYRAPEASPELRVRAGAGEVVYAGFWRRFAARVLDHFIVFIPVYMVVLAFAGGMGAFERMKTGESGGGGFLAAVYLLPMLANFFYFSAMHSSEWQATVGKMALGIKVTDANGGRLSFGQAAARWFAAALSYLTFYVGFIMAGFTEHKRALHDMLASTQVVDKWAYTSTPEKQSQGMSGCLIVFIVLFVGGLFIVPIIAAVAVSQYQDYVIRAQVSEGVALADGVKTAYAEYVSNRPGTLPSSNADAGLPEPAQIHGTYVGSVDIGSTPGSIVVTYSSQPPMKANSMLAGKHLYFDTHVGSTSIEWTCRSGELKQKWCPRACSCGG
jgi:uncharacterized RDD family membrane protein YckC